MKQCLLNPQPSKSVTSCYVSLHDRAIIAPSESLVKISYRILHYFPISSSLRFFTSAPHNSFTHPEGSTL